MGVEVSKIFRGRSREDVFNDCKKNVHDGLNLDRADFLQISGEVRWQLENDMAVQLVDIAEHLGISVPKIGLINDWDERLEGYDEEPTLRETVAHAAVNAENPSGIIRLSPFYLKEEINNRVGVNQQKPVPLGYVLPHESFHIWQFYSQYDQLLIDFNTSMASGFSWEKWEETKTEREAKEFCNMWLISHSSPYL